ncbi:hypothetical protein BCR43DRAFT_506720 [Syncephalastrum racemosum]|uniref:HECT-type E3 ubiquitin transferase n=1 Tax=Syncephalastrum racemosum TaxID=13706 RepID=A0A1X2H8D2_SYNRA|nr:hypothetical protein BCR43DRAFT_506720 [Syncephalastrum racemosum]
MPSILERRRMQGQQQLFHQQSSHSVLEPSSPSIANSQPTIPQSAAAHHHHHHHHHHTHHPPPFHGDRVAAESSARDHRYDLDSTSIPKPASPSRSNSFSQESDATPDDSPSASPSPTSNARRRPSALSVKTVKLTKDNAYLMRDSTANGNNTSNSNNNSTCQHLCHYNKQPSKHSGKSIHANSSSSPSSPSSTFLALHAKDPSEMKSSALSPSSRPSSVPRRLRKMQIKEAKHDYEATVEAYYDQLTNGCGRPDCRNRFCASGNGGIRNLHSQAALVMAIQLASKQDARLCPPPAVTSPSPSKPASHSVLDHASKDTKDAPTPFLQSLFSSSAFLTLFGLHADRRNKRTSRRSRSPPHKCARDEPSINQGCSKRPREAALRRTTLGLAAANTYCIGRRSAPDPVDDSKYYELDSDTSSLASCESDTSSSASSDSTSDDLLSIRPIAIDLCAGVEEVYRFIESKDMQRMRRWSRAIFQNWEGIGNSFCQDGQIHLEHLSEFYEVIFRVGCAEAIAESLETLLDRMKLNVEYCAQKDEATLSEWGRALLAVSEWIRLWHECPGFGTPDRPQIQHTKKDHIETTSTWAAVLSDKFIQVMSIITTQPRLSHVLQVMFSRLDAARMKQLVQQLHKYILEHFHTGPYKLGERDPMIMAVKCLGLVHQANVRDQPVIPSSDFCSQDICDKLNIKDEYRIWRRVLEHGEGRHSVSAIAASMARPSSSAAVQRYLGLSEQQRSTRLFLTTTSTSILLPYPFANEYQFAWFSYPFLLPAAVKRKILHMEAMTQMSAEYEDACVNHTLVVHAQRLLSDAPRMVRNLETNLKSATCPYLLLEIRREHFLQDVFHQISHKWASLKKPLKVKFVDGGEEGVDQGGVQKEFFGVLFEKLIALGLFEVDPATRLCWLRTMPEPDIRTYEMVGVLMGLAIYNGVIMNLQLPSVMWKVFVQPSEASVDASSQQHRLFTLDDLEEGWPALASGLRQLLAWPDEVQDVFCRNYEISLDVCGSVQTVPLIENGEEIPVTNANRAAFVRDYSHRAELLALRRGLWSVIGSPAMDLCTADTLEVVACGQRQGADGADLDLAELEGVTEYDDGYNANHPVIRDRVPVGGLKELTFVVQRNGPDSDRLPTALTCFSRLLLPEYATRDKLRDRLITAIENAKGFGLV